MYKSTTSRNTPHVSRAIRTEGGCFYKISYEDRSDWISASELAQSESKTFAKLANSLVHPFVTSASKTNLKESVQNFRKFEKGVVAAQPGWVGRSTYVHSNGDVTSYQGSKSRPIITFAIDGRTTPKGTHKRWKGTLGRLLPDNKIATFLFGYSLVGPLLRKAPPHLINPTVELIGNRQFGKSILATSAASVWGGNLGSSLGYGHSWNMTKHAFTDMRPMHNDGLLYLDESNIQDDALMKEGGISFLHSASDTRARVGESGINNQARTALLSTGNKSLSERYKGDAATVEAAMSRIIPIELNGPIVDSLPNGFSSTREVADELRKLADMQYGTAGRAFVEKVANECAKGEPRFKKRIVSLMKRFRNSVAEIDNPSDRIVDAISLTYAAMVLARKWKITPRSFADPMDSALHVFEMVSRSMRNASPKPPEELLCSIIRSNADNIQVGRIRDKKRKRKAETKPFGHKISGKDGAATYYLDPPQTRRALGMNQRQILRDLGELGILKTENGKQKKLMIKAPSYIALEGRVYAFVLPNGIDD